MSRLPRLAFAAVVTAFGCYAAFRSFAQVGPISPCDSDPTVPVAIYEVGGYSLGGPVHERLTVYSTGLASWSSSGFLGGDAQFTFVPQTAIDKLRKELRQAGANSLCDLPELVSDMPQTHVTVFTGNGANLRAHIYTYFLASTPDHQKVETILKTFISTWFPPSGV